MTVAVAIPAIITVASAATIIVITTGAIIAGVRHRHAASIVARHGGTVNADAVTVKAGRRNTAAGTLVHIAMPRASAVANRLLHEAVFGKSGGAAAERGPEGDARAKAGRAMALAGPTKKRAGRAAGATRPEVALRSGRAALRRDRWCRRSVRAGHYR